MEAQTQTCQSCKADFVIEPEDFAFYDKIKVPPPTWCPDCRAQRRMAFRNNRPLYKRKSDLSGDTVFSTFPEDAPFPLYSQKEWYSDNFDPLSFGFEYDFDVPFFEQFKTLYTTVPRPAKTMISSENSDYSNMASRVKNCYLLFGATNAQDSAYGVDYGRCSDCIDNTLLEECELSYENFDMVRSSQVFFSMNIADSNDIWFSKGLRGCTSCFGCTNLRKKSYCIFNVQYTRDEYYKKLEKMGYDAGSYKSVQDMIKRSYQEWIKFPNKSITDGTKSVDVHGEYIFSSKNVKNSFEIQGGQDLRYCQGLMEPTSRSCYDISTFGMNLELSYDSAGVGQDDANVKFCNTVYKGAHDVQYSDHCIGGVSNLFACISLREKKYCIFNRQYSKEEYEDLVPKIKQHMNDMPYTDSKGRIYTYGEFWPPEWSPFSYDESMAQEHFPLSKEQAVAQGFVWHDKPAPKHKPTVTAVDLPDHINDVDDSMLQEVIGCAHEGNCQQNCTIAFKLIPMELQFYRRFKLPLPRLCPNCRHYERAKKRNSIHLTKRSCQCAGATDDQGVYTNVGLSHPTHSDSEHCPVEFETAYSDKQPEIVYCRDCYQQELQ